MIYQKQDPLKLPFRGTPTMSMHERYITYKVSPTNVVFESQYLKSNTFLLVNCWYMYLIPHYQCFVKNTKIIIT